MKLCLISLGALPCHMVERRSNPGGSETQTTLLALALAERGHDVSMVVTDYDAEARSLPRATTMPLYNAFNTGEGIPGLRFFTPRWRGLHRALADADADAYFQMCASSLTGLVANFCGRRRRGMVYATASDTDVDPARVRLPRHHRFLYHYGLRRVDRVVTQHAEQQATLLRTVGVNSTVIGMSARIPEQLSEPGAPPMVLWVANFRSLKHPEIFLEAARRFPNTEFHMVGGSVPDEPGLFERVKTEAAALGNVTLHGHISDPSSFYERAWVLLNTSSIEGFPTTFLEAWGHGAPTVSFFDPGHLIATTKSGLVASTKEELFDHLALVLGSREERDAMGRRGLAYVRKEHASDVVTARFERELQWAAAAHGRAETPPA